MSAGTPELSDAIGIGTTFRSQGKAPRLCTVIDILWTFNSRAELVKVRYVAEHEFLGQKVLDNDVCKTTILRGLVSVGPAAPAESGPAERSPLAQGKTEAEALIKKALEASEYFDGFADPHARKLGEELYEAAQAAKAAQTAQVGEPAQANAQENAKESGYWTEDPLHPHADWRYEVAHGNTLQGYQAWLAAILEADEGQHLTR